MKVHEKKAIRRALDWVMSEHHDADDLRSVPFKAVRLAQLRAGRCYNYQTTVESQEYTERYNADLIEGEEPITVTEMAEIMKG